MYMEKKIVDYVCPLFHINKLYFVFFFLEEIFSKKSVYVTKPQCRILNHNLKKIKL